MLLKQIVGKLVRINKNFAIFKIFQKLFFEIRFISMRLQIRKSKFAALQQCRYEISTK